MKRILSLLTVVCASAVVLAQSTVRKFVLDMTIDGESTLTCYLPVNPTGRSIVDCPGGGYSHLSMENEGHDWATYFNDKGIAYFVLKYRMPHGDRSLPMSDAFQAIRTVRDSASVWHLNPRDVGIMGFSAGGHLASTVSTHAEYDVRPDFSILFYPVISMNERETHKGSCVNFLGEDQSNAEVVRDFSNANAVRSHLTPRAYIILANDDDAVSPVTNAVAYYTAMRNCGNPCAMSIYPSGGHGFGFRTTYKFHDQMLSDLTRWLDSFQAPAEDAIRVACIGNSITDGFGIGMSDEKGYPAVLQQKLGEGYFVRNYGVSSRTLLNKGDLPYVNELAWRDALAFNPQIVIVKLGTNDSKPENWQYGEDFSSDLTQMVDTLKSLPSRPEIYIATPIPAFKTTWNINDSVIANHIIPIIQKVAKKKKCHVIDLHSTFTDASLVMPDGIHPNKKGAECLAELVYEAIGEQKKENRSHL